MLGVLMPEPIQEHLFDRLIVSRQKMAYCVAADKVADLFGEVLDVIAGALQ